MTTTTLTHDEIRAIGNHFAARHGIDRANWSAITNETIRDAFPDAMGAAVRGSVVVVIHAQCPVCDAALCNHAKIETEEAFGPELIDAMILAHVRGADEGETR